MDRELLQKPKAEKPCATVGAWMPVVDRARCEGKRECEAACPYDVFEVKRIDEDEYRALGPLTRFKLRVHDKQTAYTPRADACGACELCVVRCPERAIRLVPRAEIAP